ncbi:MAG: aminopeptidase P N-terminal domain-containing protein [Acidimicrobiia bacterium]
MYATRRQQLFDLLGDRIAVIKAGAEMTRNRDTEYEFRQDSDFYYLTGFEEPDSIAVLNPMHPTERFVLFVRPKDKEQETWVGRRAGVEGAMADFGADAAYPLSSFDAKLREYLLGAPMLFCMTGTMAALIDGVASSRAFRDRTGRTAPAAIADLEPLIAELRLRKQEPEIALLRRASEISVAGHLAAMQGARDGLRENQVQAMMEYTFRAGGSVRNGYPSIVASGPNACILHYNENTRVMNDGDLLLIDAAAEYGYYSADITRTFPVSGTFSPEQAAVYEVVLDAQNAALSRIKPGAPFEIMHNAVRDVITAGLIDLGLLPDGYPAAMHHYREYFMHGTGHWLGMDVHDVGAYKTVSGSRSLEPGMVFTVEPGIYVDPERRVLELPLLEYDLDEWSERRYRLGAEAAKDLENKEREAAGFVEHRIPDGFSGIGVRIEDDVVVTSIGYENLTGQLPRKLDEVEAACS